MAGPPREAHLPQGAALVGTDPLGRIVWVSATTQEKKFYKHDELGRSPQHTTTAVENPAFIADHPDYADRIIYVGQDRPPADVAMAPRRRILIVATSSNPSGLLITGWDETRSTLQVEVGRGTKR